MTKDVGIGGLRYILFWIVFVESGILLNDKILSNIGKIVIKFLRYDNNYLRCGLIKSFFVNFCCVMFFDCQNTVGGLTKSHRPIGLP
jgi:hypothetical protein